MNSNPSCSLFSVIEGIELELLAQLSDSLALTMTYGFMDGKYKNFTVDDYLYDPTTFVTTISPVDTAAGSLPSIDVT